MPSLTAVILAAGQGTRMHSALSKMLHALCGRPLVGWPIAAALEAGADAIVVVDSAVNTLEGRLPDGARDPRRPARAQRHRRRGPGRGRHIDPAGTVVVLPGDVPLITGRGDRRAGPATTRSRAAATMATMTLEDPSGYGRVVRDDDGHVERVVETKTAGDATKEQLAIREVNSAIFAFDGAPLLAALGSSAPTTRRASSTCPTSCPPCARPATASRAHALADRKLALGVNDRVQLARGPRHRPERIHDAHRAPASRSSTRLDAHRHRASRSARTRRRAEQLPQGHDDDRARLHRRAADDAHRRDAARRGHDPAFLRRRRRDRGQRDRRPVRLPAPGHGAQRALEGRHVRRDQELRRRPRQQGAAPLLHRRRGHRRGHQPRRRDDHRQLRRGRQAPHDDRRPRAHERRHDARRAGQLGDDAYTAANSAITQDVPPGALGVARARQTNIEGYADRKRRTKP